MNKSRMKYIIAILLVVALCIGVWDWYAMPSFAEFLDEPIAQVELFEEQEAICASFFRENMISAQFDLYTNYQETPDKGDLATGHDVLAESYGLLMMRAVMKRDFGLFDDCNRYVTEQLWDGDILPWRKNSVSGEKATVNASVDDLRVIQSLLLGSTVWQDRPMYRQAKKMTKKLYTHNVQKGYFVDLYDAATETKSTNATLCYQNLKAFQMLGKIDFRWKEVYKKAENLVQEGYLGDVLPLYHTRKNLQSDAYETETVNIIESLLTVLHLAEVSAARQETLTWLKQQVEQGTLYSLYDRKTGAAATDLQSTAAYAISAMIGAQTGDAELYRIAMQKMNRYQILDTRSDIWGAYGDDASQMVYSFDNLYALLAFCYG